MLNSLHWGFLEFNQRKSKQIWMGSRKFGSVRKTNKNCFKNIDQERVQELAESTQSRIDNIRRYGFPEKWWYFFLNRGPKFVFKSFYFNKIGQLDQKISLDSSVLCGFFLITRHLKKLFTRPKKNFKWKVFNYMPIPFKSIINML